jgi:hypothetical protein
VVSALPIVVAIGAKAPPRLARKALPLLGALAIAGGCYVFNRVYYARDEAWKSFYAYNAARAEFTDFDRVQPGPEAGRALKTVGWERIDLGMLKNWFFADQSRFSFTNLRRVLDQVPRPSPRFDQVAGSIVRQFPANADLARLALAGVCVALLAGNGWRGLILPAALFATAFAAAVCLGAWYWVTPRIAFPLMFGVTALSAFSAASSEDKLPPTGRRLRGVGLVIRWMAALGAVALTASTLVDVFHQDAYRRAQRLDSERLIGQLNPQRDQLYVVWAEWFPFRQLVPPLADPVSLRDFRCVALSWLLPTPLTEARYRDFAISDIHRALWERPDVFLTADNNLVVLLRVYLARHYGTMVDFRPTFEYSTFRVYQGHAPADSRPTKER